MIDLGPIQREFKGHNCEGHGHQIQCSSVGRAPDGAIRRPGLESWLGMVCHYFSHHSVIDAVPTNRSA